MHGATNRKSNIVSLQQNLDMVAIIQIYNMGTTDSHSCSFRLDQHYRLVRRFISDFYSAEITVVEHKVTKQQLALRESVLQFNAGTVAQQMENRKALNNRNFIALRHYWLQNDLSICSSFFKLHALFEYHENMLEDAASEGDSWNDAEVVDFVRQMVSGLSFLQRNQMTYLLAGPKSIAIAEEEHHSASDDEAVTEIRALRDISQQQRCSLVDISKKSSAGELAKQRLTDLRALRRRRVYKLFEPFEGLTGTRALHNLQNYMQVPLHPLLANHHEQLLSEPLIKLQNLFTVVLIATALTEGSDVFQLNVFKSGRLSLDKLKVKVEELKETHPRTSVQLLKLMSVHSSNEKEYRTGQTGVKLKEFSFVVKKERSASQDKLINLIDTKVNRVKSRKRISLLQI